MDRCLLTSFVGRLLSLVWIFLSGFPFVMHTNVFVVLGQEHTVALHGPDQKHHAPWFGALWGIAMGWLSPAHTSAFVPLIPAGCNAEWMGFYILATSVLSWLPPAVFSVLHELGWSMNVGLMSLNVFFAAALVCLRQVGHFAHAVDAVQSANAANAAGSGGTAGQRHELT
jgi:MFS-type transporter involved in bile tolerance (Atg22 family)